MFKDLTLKNYLMNNGSIQGAHLKCGTKKSNRSFDVDGLQAQSIESNGSFTRKNIEIPDESKFNGGLEIQNSHLHDIQIASVTLTFVETKVNGNIRIKNKCKS